MSTSQEEVLELQELFKRYQKVCPTPLEYHDLVHSVINSREPNDNNYTVLERMKFLLEALITCWTTPLDFNAPRMPFKGPFDEKIEDFKKNLLRLMRYKDATVTVIWQLEYIAYRVIYSHVLNGTKYTGYAFADLNDIDAALPMVYEQLCIFKWEKEKVGEN